jgi:hypothetical protein
MSHNYLAVFAELIRTPFQHLGLVWGIVPLYFALVLNEVTSDKKSFRTAIQTGFSFLWAGAQWLYLCRNAAASPTAGEVALKGIPPINLVVTGLVLVLGAAALYSGLRRHYPRYASFLGHTRFSNYFMITIYPIQAHALDWTWKRLAAIVIFAVPVWLVLHFGLMPLRGRK